MGKDTPFFLFLQRFFEQNMRRLTRKEKIQAWLSEPYMLLIYRLLVILLALSISRWMLYLFNTQFFHQLDLGQALSLYLYGMRFDVPIVIALNLIVIIYYCFPSKIIYRKWLQQVIDILYVTVNSIAILISFVSISLPNTSRLTS